MNEFESRKITVEAKQAYDTAKHKYFGEFAYDDLQEVNNEL